MHRRRKILTALSVLAVIAPLSAVLAVTTGASAAANPLPVTVTNNTGRSEPVYLYILSENLTTHAQGYVNAAGQFTAWSGGGLPPSPAPDVAIPGPANGASATLRIPQGVNGRIYFSFGEKLKLFLVPGGKLVQPAPWVSGDANFNILLDWSEFTYDAAGLFINSTQVDMVAVPHVVSVTGASGTQRTGQVVADGRNKIINAVKAQSGFDRSVITRSDGTVLRVLAPGKALDAGLMSATYLDAYINTAWAAYASKPLTVVPYQEDPAQKFTGTVSGNTMTFRNTSGAVVATFNKPVTKDVWGCAGNLAAPNDIVGAISRTLCAALNRSTLGATSTEPDYNAADFYKGTLTNHFSRIVHANMVDGRAYGFPFDDVGHFESLVHDANPSSASITLTTFGAGGPPPSPQPTPSTGPSPQPTTGPTTPPPPSNPGTTTWAPYTAYSVGQVVTYGGVRYQCRQSHTSIPGWEPPAVPALWQPI
ncbi:MAG: hypothetical protein QOI35_2010 [Cryptosporangiaceae bacterium]|nr:hypothetical protein [Cryptosporangiaceae bacterium]